MEHTYEEFIKEIVHSTQYNIDISFKEENGVLYVCHKNFKKVFNICYSSPLHEALLLAAKQSIEIAIEYGDYVVC